jgi:hypothetical protein
VLKKPADFASAEAERYSRGNRIDGSAKPWHIRTARGNFSSGASKDPIWQDSSAPFWPLPKRAIPGPQQWKTQSRQEEVAGGDAKALRVSVRKGTVIVSSIEI